MDGAPHNSEPDNKQADSRVASGRPARAGHVTFGEGAAQLFEQGFEPLPIRPGTKVPAVSRWSNVPIDAATIDRWCQKYADHGIGQRTGHLVGLDIDILDDPDEAHRVHVLARQRLGESPVRVGLWPKRLLLYRTNTPFRKLSAGRIEVLGLGQQFVAFGLHPDTGQPYSWLDGETPLDFTLEDLPLVDEEMMKAFLAEAAPGPQRASGGPRKAGPGFQGIRRENGLVVDGRDGWLSRSAFHVVHDGLDAGQATEVEHLADLVWSRFADSTDLGRPRKDGAGPYTIRDARKKVADKLRLTRDGHLPPRDTDVPEPDHAPPALTATEGRDRLQILLKQFCSGVLDWHSARSGDPPALGIRATVGLGKSHAAREHVLALMAKLRARNLPHRVLVFTPSHALAEETAAAWSGAGFDVSVLRGYERKLPSGDPMCRDIEMVRASLDSRLPVHRTACESKDGTRCRMFETCLKQRNRREVAAADVVVAPYDALFSGFAFEEDNMALILVDEGCWQRAVEVDRALTVEDLLTEPVSSMGGDRVGRGPVGAMADLVASRERLVRALVPVAEGSAIVPALKSAGLTHDDCLHAAKLEDWRKRDTELAPGLAAGRRASAFAAAKAIDRIDRLAGMWTALADLMRFGAQPGRLLQVQKPDGAGRHVIEMRRLKRLHDSLRGKPVLHLDATLRPELAGSVLPPMPIETIDVSAPHMHVRHIQGSFGKSMLCPQPGLAEAELRRRENRLQECVDHVRWHARRVFPAEVLVVTYQAIEAAFQGIPNVETAHFNAVAGLDCYKDVRLLIEVGRPLPPSAEAEMLAQVYLGTVAQSGYARTRAGIHMRSGMIRGLPVVRHSDDHAEVLRAAICDDEVVQVIGRGRGVNRTAENPLEVHILSDVALPLVYDQLTTWDNEKPDLFQQMLLRGIATDSPADAAALHPEMFASANQAKLAFNRGVFKCQNPMNISYREMTLKSAAYRRPGRGRGWQRAWWIDGDAEAASAMLESAVGPLAEWVLQPPRQR